MSAYDEASFEPTLETSASPGLPAPSGLGVATFVIALARFMVVLDGTIMIVALPSVGRSLHMAASDLNWVLNAYALTFGGLMLVAGRVGDLFGRKRVFRAGLVLFGTASLLGGLAPTGTALVVSRGLQGIGAAVATPGALSLLVSTFPEGERRTRALGLYGAATGMASVTGLLAGGVLTTYASWRWVLWVNVPLVVVILPGITALSEGETERTSIDLRGAVFATFGVGALILAVNRVAEDGWSDAVVLACLAVAAALLVEFVYAQRSSPAPMIPRGVLNEPGRAAANAVTVLTAAGTFATFYFVTLYLQQVRGYSPLRTGLMFLPFAVGAGLATGAVGPQLLKRASERVALSLGLLLSAAGTGWFCTLTPHSAFLAVLMPASALTGVGIGVTAVAGTAIGVRGIDSSEAGIGSALLTAGGQVGAALGVAALAGVAVWRSGHAANGADPGGALTRGYVAGFEVAIGLYAVCLVITLVVVRPMVQGPREAE
ncbi:MFS transporter [Catenulispora subtropica]